MDACPHTEHRRDRATGRTIGYDPRVNEWGPCAVREEEVTGEVGREVYPSTWFRCRECGWSVLGDNALAEHRREHVSRGEGAPEWDVADDDD